MYHSAQCSRPDPKNDILWPVAKKRREKQKAVDFAACSVDSGEHVHQTQLLDRREDSTVDYIHTSPHSLVSCFWVEHLQDIDYRVREHAGFVKNPSTLS